MTTRKPSCIRHPFGNFKMWRMLILSRGTWSIGKKYELATNF